MLTMANSVILHLLVAQIVLLFPGNPDMLVSQASTLSDEGTVYASLGGDVVIPWTLTLDQGSTIRNLVWQKDPSTRVAQLLFSGTIFSPDAAYRTRVTAVPGSTASFNLTGITETDVGTYRCSVSVNDGGTIVQLDDTQDLEILELPRNVTVSSTVKGVIFAGARVTITCHSTGGNPPPSYIWLKDGTAIGTTTNSLVISSFQTQDKGNYTCIASNIAGHVTSSTSVQLTFDNEVTRISYIVLGVTVPLIFLVPLAILIWCLGRGPQKPTIIIEPSPSSHREVEVKWTGESEGTYRVLYRTKGSHDWTSGPEVSTNDPHNYKYTVTFPKHGCYEVCVQGTITCWQCKVTSDIMEVTVPIIDTAPYGSSGNDDGSSGGRNMPVNVSVTSKADLPLVFMITEGQSRKVKLDPIVGMQNPTDKKGKKEKQKKGEQC